MLRKNIVKIMAAAIAVVGLSLVASNSSMAATPYAKHGQLSVKGSKIVDKSGKTFQLKGVSTHGISWFPDYVNKKAFKTLRNKWKANIIRLAMYTEEYNGYLSGGNKDDLEKTIDKGVKAATSLGMYSIVDWHILSDGNPNTHKSEAKTFFEKMSKKYANNPQVLYELCNEPNGGTTWSNIKSYAEEIIPIIRKNAPKAIIIVGTPTWSQEVDKPAADPIKGYDNIVYTCHFYAATHKDDLRNRVESAVKSGLPVFISEFSICDASGNGAIDYASAKAWKKLINKYKLPYVAWNLSNKNEASALIKSNVKSLSGWKKSQLSATGKWISKMMQGK